MEKEWLDTLSTINPEEVTYTDYVESGNALAKELRGKGCQFIIALTHMRTPNDLRLAANAPEIDLILGGHDHVYEKKDVRRTQCGNYRIFQSLRFLREINSMKLALINCHFSQFFETFKVDFTQNSK